MLFVDKSTAQSNFWAWHQAQIQQIGQWGKKDEKNTRFKCCDKIHLTGAATKKPFDKIGKALNLWSIINGFKYNKREMHYKGDG